MRKDFRRLIAFFAMIAIVVSSVFAYKSAAEETPLSLGVAKNYSVFVEGDFKVTEADCEGDLFAGGDVETPANYNVGRLSNRLAVVNGTYTGFDSTVTVKTPSEVGIDTSKEFANLRATSSKLAKFTANGEVTKNPYNDEIYFTGSDEKINVFNLYVSEWEAFVGNDGRACVIINAPASSTILINIIGGGLTSIPVNCSCKWNGADVTNGSSNNSKILWNVPDTNNFAVSSSMGCLLAPNSNVSTVPGESNDHFEGQLICKSFSGNTEFGHVKFDGTLVNPKVEEPTPEPTPEPTEEPTPVPTEEPTVVPTEEPTPAPVVPTEEPTPAPAEDPTVEPTPVPTEEPTVEPTPVPVVPTEEPTPVPVVPTEEPTPAPVVPTAEPTPAPVVPTAEPTPVPVVPTEEPTPAPVVPTPVVPTVEPTPIVPVRPTPVVPTVEPTVEPTPVVPTTDPTVEPTPIATPTTEPTTEPTPAPTTDPTDTPTPTPEAQIPSSGIVTNPDGSKGVTDQYKKVLGAGRHKVVVTNPDGSTETIEVEVTRLEMAVATGESAVSITAIAAIALFLVAGCIFISRVGKNED